MFVDECLLKNEPCIFAESVTMEWKARRLWQGEGGRPDFDYLLKEFGMRRTQILGSLLLICRNSNRE